MAVVPDSPYDASGAYSGSALVLTGTEVGAAPARAPYQLFYTGNLKDPVTDERTASQCLVTSADRDDFAKWPANPLIADHAPGYTAHYRDPQVSRAPEPTACSSGSSAPTRRARPCSTARATC